MSATLSNHLFLGNSVLQCTCLQVTKRFRGIVSFAEGSGYFAGPGKIAPRGYFAGPGKIRPIFSFISIFYYFIYLFISDNYVFKIRIHILKMLIKDFIQIQMGVWLAFWNTLKGNPF